MNGWSYSSVPLYTFMAWTRATWLVLNVQVSWREAKFQKSVIRRMSYFNHAADKSQYSWTVIVTTVY